MPDVEGLWDVRKREGEPINYGRDSGYDPGNHTDTEFERDVLYALNGHAGSGARVREAYNYPGSPAPAFGQTGIEDRDCRKWPVVEAHVSLPSGRNDLRHDLARRLRQVIDDFIIDNRLTANPDSE